jgi:hypothetical protein
MKISIFAPVKCEILNLTYHSGAESYRLFVRKSKNRRNNLEFKPKY